MALEESINGAQPAVAVRPSTSTLATDTVRSRLAVEQVNISPGVAQAWLDRNLRNRKPRQNLIDRLASDIRSGKWEVSGDPIRFDTDGNLIDGQHRLMACVAANTTIRSFVVYGLDPSTQNIIDTGAPRSKGDMLALHGIANANSVAIAFRLLYNHKHGAALSNSKLTHADMIDLLEVHPKLPLYVPHPGSIPKGITLGMVGFVAYVGAVILKKKDRVDAMMAVLKTGVPDYVGDPMHKFRERILTKRGIDPGDGKEKRAHMFYTFYYAWNLFAKKEPVSRLNVQRDEVKIEWLKSSQL